MRSVEEERDWQAEPGSESPPALVRAPIAPEPEPPEIEAALEDKAARKEQRSLLQVVLSGLIGGLDIGFSPLGMAFVAGLRGPDHRDVGRGHVG